MSENKPSLHARVLEAIADDAAPEVQRHRCAAIAAAGDARIAELEAEVARLSAPVVAEPVAYQYRFDSPFGGQVWRHKPDTWNGNEALSMRKLYPESALRCTAADWKGIDMSDRNIRDALAELVACEDMRLRLRALHESGHGTDYDAHLNQFAGAWLAARAALAAQPAPSGNVLVNGGALQMALNILRRGTPVQREAAEALADTCAAPYNKRMRDMTEDDFNEALGVKPK